MGDINKSSFIERFKNPALWLTIIGCFVWIIIRLNSIEVNTKDIKTVEQRLDKKIEILNSLDIKFHKSEIKFKDEIHKIKLATKEKEIELLKLIHEIRTELNDTELELLKAIHKIELND